MNLQAPISSLMTTNLIIVNADDKLLIVKNIMEEHGIHHVPVLRFNKLVGLISKTDLSFFLKGVNTDGFQETVRKIQLENLTAEEVMTRDLECLLAANSIETALNLFQKNEFHAIPIVNTENEIQGIVTTFDIINKLVEKIDPT